VTEPRICVVAYDGTQPPDAALAQAARRLGAIGVKVGGLLQSGAAGDAARCAMLFLEDLGTGRSIRLFEARGVGARGCRLDACGLAEAAVWLREAVESKPDVLFINRFGRQESNGRGLLDEIGAAVTAGVPVVIAVSAACLPAWRAFAGAEDALVPADADRIVTWALETPRLRDDWPARGPGASRGTREVCAELHDFV
jgi:hypothetical protein